MFRWFKIVKDQYFGLWLIGLLLFAIQEIPYMIMPLLPLEANPITDLPVNSLFLDVCEKIFGILCVSATVLIVNKNSALFSVKTKSEIGFFSAAVCAITLNFIGWALYFCGYQSVAVMLVFLFALPPLYYLFIGLWRKNMILVVAAGIFFILHFTNGCIGLL